MYLMQPIQICFESGKTEMHWSVAISLSLIWYQGKDLKVSRKTWDFTFPLYSALSCLMCEACFTFTWDKSEESPAGQLKFLHLEEKGLIQSDSKTVWVSCLFDLQTKGPPANLTGMFFLPSWVCCLQTTQSTANFLIPLIDSRADALGTIEKCALLK